MTTRRAHRRGAASLAGWRARGLRTPALHPHRARGAQPSLSIVGSVAVARNITGPLETLAAAATRIEQGDYADR